MVRIEDFESEDFGHLVIEEKDECYIISMLNDDEGELRIRRDKNYGISDIAKIIYMFLTIMKINKISKKISFVKDGSDRTNYYIEASCLGNNKKMTLDMFDPIFKFVLDEITDKYIGDRDIFFKNNDTNEMRISFGCQKFMYEMNNGIINIMLGIDENGKLISFEEKFIRGYLYDKFSLINEVVEVFDVDNNDSKNKECVVRCGNFKISIPQNYAFDILLDIINDYNNGKIKNKKR